MYQSVIVKRSFGVNSCAGKRNLIEGLETRRFLSRDGINTIQDGKVYPIPSFDTTVVSIKHADGSLDSDNLAHVGDGIRSIVLADYYGFGLTEFSLDDNGVMTMIADGQQYDVLLDGNMDPTAADPGADVMAKVIEGRPLSNPFAIQTGFAVRMNPESGWEIYQLAIREELLPVPAESGTVETDQPSEPETATPGELITCEGFTSTDVPTVDENGQPIPRCTFPAYVPEPILETVVTPDAAPSEPAPAAEQPEPEAALEIDASAFAMAMPAIGTYKLANSFAGSFFADKKDQDDGQLAI